MLEAQNGGLQIHLGSDQLKLAREETSVEFSRTSVHSRVLHRCATFTTMTQTDQRLFR